jgi:hypothetical protein
MKFLETITAFGDNILIPIDRIQYIAIRYGVNGWEIHIVGDDEMDIVECFQKDDDKLNKRYEMIKKIIEAK